MWQLAGLHEFWQFLLFSLVYSLVYSPTLSLTNSLAFHHLPDRDRDFGRVRVWGTLGWIVVGISMAQWLFYKHTPPDVTDTKARLAAQVLGMADAFRLASILGLVMGVYCFMLPDTPPAKGARKNASLEALSEIKKNPLLTLFLLAVPISCIHQFYFYHAANFLGEFQESAKGLFETINKIFGVGGGGLMTVGQMSELVVLAAMPLLAKHLSRKTLLGIGIAAYGLRMFLFGYVGQIVAATGLSPVPILITGVAMHGLCFGCFIFVAFMVVDEETTGDVRASPELVQLGDRRRGNHRGQFGRRPRQRVGESRRHARLYATIQRAHVDRRGLPRATAALLPERTAGSARFKWPQGPLSGRRGL